MNFYTLYQTHVSSLSTSEKYICDFILQNQNEMIEYTLNDISDLTFTSKSSVWRTIQKLGFESFSKFKFSIDWNTKESKNSQNTLLWSLEDLVEKIKATNFTDACQLLVAQKNIYILYSGYTQKNQAEYLQLSLLKRSILSTIVLNEPSSNITQIITDNLTPEDLIICFSGTGENRYMKRWCDIPIKKNIPILSFTTNEYSWLSRNATYNFSFYPKSKEYSFFPSTNHIVIDALMDTLDLV